jgi:anti-sigma factor RsiW
MSHQPFEDRLLSRQELSADEASGLQAHLAECPACASLASALEAVEAQLRFADPVRPAPGFTGRWRSRLARSQARRKERQAWAVLAFSSSCALLLLAVIVVSFMAAPGNWAARGLQSLAGWIADMSLAWSLAGAFVGSLPAPIPAVSGLGLALGGSVCLVGLAAAWFITVRRFAWTAHRGGMK